jgi:hypothetical protein
MKIKMCTAIAGILLSLAASPQPSHAEQGVPAFADRVAELDAPLTLTAGALDSLVQGILDKLQNLAASLSGDLSISVGGAGSQLSALLTQFQQATQQSIGQPISDLSDSAQAMARQLQYATNRLQDILAHERACLLQNAGVIIASLDSLTLQLKSGIPLVKDSKAQLYYFQFAGHSPSIVPPDGGPMTLVGFALWKRQPRLELCDEAKHSLTSLQASRSTDDNSVDTIIPGPLLQQNAGKCLFIHCVTQKGNFLGLTVPDTDLYLPLFVPQTLAFKWHVDAWVSYETTGTSPETVGPEKVYRFDNNTCDKQNVSQTQGWSLPVDAQIIGTQDRDLGDSRQNNAISLSIVANTITAAGTMDQGSCVNMLFGSTLLHSAIWDHGISPKYIYPVTTTNSTSGSSESSGIGSTTTQVVVAVPKAQGKGNATFWYQVVPMVNGVAQSELYLSPRVTIGPDASSGQDEGQAEQCNMDATYNPQPINGNSQLNVTITVPACGF